VRFTRKTTLPAILINGFNTWDVTYDANQIWKEGTTTAGSGFCSGGMVWDQDTGFVTVPTSGCYLVNWHPMQTNSGDHTGEQGWRIIKLQTNKVEFDIAAHHWNGSGGSSIAVSTITIVQMKAGERIQVRAHPTNLPRIYGAEAHTFLAVHKLGSQED